MSYYIEGETVIRSQGSGESIPKWFIGNQQLGGRNMREYTSISGTIYTWIDNVINGYIRIENENKDLRKNNKKDDKKQEKLDFTKYNGDKIEYASNLLFQELRKECNTKRISTNNLLEDIRNMITSVKNIKEEYTKKDKELEEIKEKLFEEIKKNDNKGKKIKELEEEVGNLRNKNSELQKIKKELEIEKNKNEKLENFRKESKEELEKLQKDRKKFEEEIENLKKEFGQQNEIIKIIRDIFGETTIEKLREYKGIYDNILEEVEKQLGIKKSNGILKILIELLEKAIENPLGKEELKRIIEELIEQRKDMYEILKDKKIMGIWKYIPDKDLKEIIELLKEGKIKEFYKKEDELKIVEKLSSIKIGEQNFLNFI